jgi:hypothetical protein
MDERSILVFLDRNRLSAKDVHTELVQVLESDAIVSSAVTKSIQNDAILQNEPEPEAEDRVENQGFSITDNGLLEALEMMSFASTRQIAKMAFIAATTLFRRLAECLQSIVKRLRAVAHRLSGLQKQVRVIQSNELLKHA